ncbi:hypothetical protein [Paraburkholderia phenazinium]|jgi:hypothetical protein|uniref:Uncharacterized protein n=1 Tax=Paraburkholderia phenazinium TaxID=60549 RepID=A0A1G8AYV5_9BURK|nr:hypothetical protein [Paraburkholderia phenazinium]SDH26097.1 hypothetical protein SAMN05216466_108152 [Paraburkholderia phenazinium]
MTADRFNSRAHTRHGRGRGADTRTPASHGHGRVREPAATPQDKRQPISPQQAAAQPISATQILIALLVAPLAWLAQVGIADMVLGASCAVGSPLFVVHTMAWTPLTVVLVSLVCLIFGGFGTLVAWRNLWRTARIPWRFPSALKGTRAERDWFLARLSALSSSMFILGLIATEIAILIIAPCSPW